MNPLHPSGPELRLLGGRLAVDFANLSPANGALGWERLIQFLEATRIIAAHRKAQLLALPDSDPTTAAALLGKAQRLGGALREAFSSKLRKQRIAPEATAPINEILRITEGHDELVAHAGGWRLEFVAREGGLDWLLAAVARSGAEMLAEDSQDRLRRCANPRCGLFFYDRSRTHLRRWCSMALCGNRSKVAAFARRRSSRYRVASSGRS